MAIEYLFRLEDFHPESCKIGKTGMCKACLKISELDNEIQRVQRTLRTLVNRRETFLKMEINRDHSPILYLPTELVMRIFRFHVDNGSEYFNKLDGSAPLILSAVCKRWREIAFADTQLWTAPMVCLYSGNKLQLQEELLAQWLDRSGDRPLDISIFPTDEFVEEFALPGNSDLSLMEVVSKVVPRLVQLDLDLPVGYFWDFVRRLEGAPRLQALFIGAPDIGKDGHFERLSLPRLPALKNIYLDPRIKLNNSKIASPSLVTCHLHALQVHEVLKILQRACNLEECSFIGIADSPPQSLPSIPICHNRIKKLEVKLNKHKISDDPLASLFQRLTLPSLQSLIFDERLCRLFTTAPFSLFLSRSQCLLCDLEINDDSFRGPGLSDEVVVDVLERLPSLLRLTLRGSSFRDKLQPTFMTDQFLQSFSRNSSQPESPSFLPHLASLELEVTGLSIPFSWEGFLSFLEACHEISGSQKQDDRLVNDSSKDVRLDICLYIIPAHSAETPRSIEPDIARRLINQEWSKSISLRVLDGKEGTDLIKAALLRTEGGVSGGNSEIIIG